MRLLNTETLELSGPYVPGQVPEYAILSHRWGSEEVTFADINKAPISDPQSQTRTKSGFAKIQGACTLARWIGYRWIWIDSCCIDKSSSAELSEAINSMWMYYENSHVCYVYLEDVPDAAAGWGPQFDTSEWFTRGWTLQELLAPTYVEIYAKNWDAIGTKFERYKQIAKITSIWPGALVSAFDIYQYSAAEKLSWASHRNVTREEDEAYSLFGLFFVNLPLLYGEGRLKAWLRLQEAIYDTSQDPTLFLYSSSERLYNHSLLASSPNFFCQRPACTLRPCRMTTEPLWFRYEDLCPSLNFRTQAMGPIKTTIRRLSTSVSVDLNVLNCGDVSLKLMNPDRKPLPRSLEHVAVLGFTLKEHPTGSLCLLIHKWSEGDGADRLEVSPALLRNVNDFKSQLKKTTLIFAPSPPAYIYVGDSTDVSFFLQSKTFHVAHWESTNLTNETIRLVDSRPHAGHNTKAKRVVISCHHPLPLDPELRLEIQVAVVCEIWSIDYISERKISDKEDVQKNRTLFSAANVPTDRCMVELREGKKLSVKLRRLCSSSRMEKHFQISVDYQ